MYHKHQQPYTLIVRLWREQLAPKTRVWRGTLECLQTRETAAFQSVEGLAAQIARMYNV